MLITRTYGLKTYKQRSAYWYKTQEQDPSALTEALARLKPDTSAVLRLHYIDKIPLADIGPRMGRSLSTVRHHITRGIFLIFHDLEYQHGP